MRWHDATINKMALTSGRVRNGKVPFNNVNEIMKLGDKN
jgi:hypothetical protein